MLWGVLFIRAGYLQFIPSDKLKTLKERQFQTVVNLPPRRGAILDREGRDLAMSSTVYSLYADPKIMTEKRKVAKALGKILRHNPNSIYAKIKDPRKRFVWISRMLDRPTADQIKDLKVRGLAFVEEWKRVYPNESLLSQTMGFIGSEGQGLEGLERKFDSDLRGSSKKVHVSRDARGRPLIQEGLMFFETPDGDDLQLTIDTELQYALEGELRTALESFGAESALGIIMDAKTSQVLALASAPLFDLNHAKKATAEVRRNRVATDSFELGSTVKTFAIAAALREGLLKPNSKYFCENGSFKVGDRTIRESSSREKFAYLTATEILAFSSNIGTTKIAFQLGAQRYREALVDFGFGQRTGIEVPGEAKGILHGLPWRPHLLSNISFGHGMTGTALQIANAYAAIANGGNLMKPSIVLSKRSGETGELKNFEPEVIRRVLSEEESQQLRMMLTASTAKGSTGYNARVDGYLVGGKTGTAQKVNPQGRGYLPGAYISSFAGFIPANDPKFVIYIAVDSPTEKSFYGSTVAAPIFSRIASFAVRRAGIAPQVLPEQSIVKPLAHFSEVIPNQQKKLETVPDLIGLTPRAVLKRLSGTDLKVRIRGEGLVSEVIPAPGSSLPDDGQVQVILR